jgi:hypothetical protein
MHAVSLEPVCLPWTALAEMLAICLIVSRLLTTGLFSPTSTFLCKHYMKPHDHELHALAERKTGFWKILIPHFLYSGHAKHPSPQSLLRLYLVHQPLKDRWRDYVDFSLFPHLRSSHMKASFLPEAQFQPFSFHFSLINVFLCFIAIIRPTTVMMPCAFAYCKKNVLHLWWMAGFHKWWWSIFVSCTWLSSSRVCQIEPYNDI